MKQIARHLRKKTSSKHQFSESDSSDVNDFNEILGSRHSFLRGDDVNNSRKASDIQSEDTSSKEEEKKEKSSKKNKPSTSRTDEGVRFLNIGKNDESSSENYTNSSDSNEDDEKDNQFTPESRESRNKTSKLPTKITSKKLTYEQLEEECKDWKTRYTLLRNEFTSLSDDYKKLLNESQHRKTDEQKGEQVIQLTKRIKELEKQLASRKTLNDDDTYTDELQEAQNKIIQQSEEIQKLLQQRFKLEKRLSDMSPTRKPREQENKDQSSNQTFEILEYERTINNLKAQLKEREQQLEILHQKLNRSQNELVKLAKAAGIVATSPKKKKKHWWSTGSKTKTKSDKQKNISSPVTLTPNTHQGLSPRIHGEQHLAFSANSDVERHSLEADFSMLNYEHETGSLADEVYRKRLLELERENARLEGEINILRREHDFFQNQVKQSEAKIEVLQTALTNKEETMKSYLVSKHISLPGSQNDNAADYAQTILQIQANALEKLSEKNAKLEQILKHYANTSGTTQLTINDCMKELQEEMAELNSEISQLRADNNELRSTMTKLTLENRSLKTENECLKKSLDTIVGEGSIRLQDLNKKVETYAVMIGQLLQDKQNIAHKLNLTEKEYLNSIKCSRDELRALQNQTMLTAQGICSISQAPMPMKFTSKSQNYSENKMQKSPQHTERLSQEHQESTTTQHNNLSPTKFPNIHHLQNPYNITDTNIRTAPMLNISSSSSTENLLNENNNISHLQYYSPSKQSPKKNISDLPDMKTSSPNKFLEESSVSIHDFNENEKHIQNFVKTHSSLQLSSEESSFQHTRNHQPVFHSVWSPQKSHYTIESKLSDAPTENRPVTVLCASTSKDCMLVPLSSENSKKDAYPEFRVTQEEQDLSTKALRKWVAERDKKATVDNQSTMGPKNALPKYSPKNSKRSINNQSTKLKHDKENIPFEDKSKMLEIPKNNKDSPDLKLSSYVNPLSPETADDQGLIQLTDMKKSACVTPEKSNSAGNEICSPPTESPYEKSEFSRNLYRQNYSAVSEVKVQAPNAPIEHKLTE